MHVIPRVGAAQNLPGAPADLDWDATLAFRHHVWSWSLGVADAADTAQRNMGLDAEATRELIARSAAEARSVGGALVVGVSAADLWRRASCLLRPDRRHLPGPRSPAPVKPMLRLPTAASPVGTSHAAAAGRVPSGPR